MTRWFPAVEDSHVVGRFVDVEVVDPKASEIAQKSVYKKVTALEAKVAGSGDTSVQAVKPFNQKELTERFPGAWEYYQEHRIEDAPKDVIPVRKAVVGHPLHEAEFIPRAKIPFLNELGFSTIEQIATMSDSVAQNLKAMKWRQQAQEQLSRT